MPHGRTETAAHGAVARMTTKGPQEMTVRARLGVVADERRGEHPFRARPFKCRVVRFARKRFARPDPRRPHDRHAGRFRGMRYVDQQSLDLPRRHRLKMLRDQVHMPVLEVDR